MQFSICGELFLWFIFLAECEILNFVDAGGILTLLLRGRLQFAISQTA